MKRITSTIVAGIIGITAMAQMPTLMLFPSEAWMKEHNYGENVSTNGRSRWNPDYQKAFDNENIDNTEISTALSTTSATLTAIGFKCEDLKQSLTGLDEDAALADEFGIDLDDAAERVIPDIKIEVNWKLVKQVLGSSQYSVQLIAKDYYTNDDIAAIDEPGTLSAEGLKGDLRRVIESHMADFSNKLKESFEKTLKYGREVKVTILLANSGMNFNTDQIEGQNMKFYFRDVLKGIAKNGVSNNKRDNARLQEYRVRIENGSKLEDISEQLQNKFSGVGVNISVKKQSVGALAIIVGES
jgi:hypothetical protein